MKPVNNCIQRKQVLMNIVTPTEPKYHQISNKVAISRMSDRIFLTRSIIDRYGKDFASKIREALFV